MKSLCSPEGAIGSSKVPRTCFLKQNCTSCLSIHAEESFTVKFVVALFHMVLVVLMSFLGLVARSFYRRKTDGAENVCFEETVNIATSIYTTEAGMGGEGEGRGGSGSGARSGSSSVEPNSNDIGRFVKDSGGKINEAAAMSANKSSSDF